MTKQLILSLLLAISVLFAGCSVWKKQPAKTKSIATVVAPKDSTSKLDKAVKEAVKQTGLFNTYYNGKTGKLYFEIPEAAFSRTYMLANRVSSISLTKDYVAGQMATAPLMLRFSKNGKNVFLHKMQYGNVVDEKDAIAPAFHSNFTDPVLSGFKIEASTDSSVLIDVTAFFGGNEKSISPIKKENPLAKMFGLAEGLKGTFEPEASAIAEVKTFPKNIEIKSMLSYTITSVNEPYTVHLNRSLFVLPDKPMTPRLADNRVGFFHTNKDLYTSSEQKIVDFAYLHRWRLEPKDEDRERYFRGELVEPRQPIVLYVDSAFPPQWRSTIMQGVTDWNTAFETAGFKNAIRAEMYPRNNPQFDPDDMRYSCIRYAASPIANAMGPSYVDPRTGEILAANVIWYHNVLSLVREWRFVQTGAVDPRVRTFNLPENVLLESLRYVAAHEVGHTIGLMHNMGASYSYPLDSLRSPAFTQKYGTTPSIMDYARNNFVAQPGDFEKGVRLVPPVLGVYDIFAINWGYRLIPGNHTPKTEKATLDRWIDEAKQNPMLEFGAQQFFATVDPTAQTEDLGNDHLRAGDLAINNLQYIMRNFESWVYSNGSNYDDIAALYKAIVKQYARHIAHVMPYIGGVEFKEIRQGDAQAAQTYLPKTEQQKAMRWLLQQARSYGGWLLPRTLAGKLPLNSTENDKIMLAIVGCLYHSAVLYRINEGGLADPQKNYTLRAYMDDVQKELFKTTYANKPLSKEDILMQNAAIDLMIAQSGLKPKSSSSSRLAAVEALDYMASLGEENWCGGSCCAHEHNTHDEAYAFTRINFGLPTLPATLAAPMMTARLKEVQQLYTARKNTPDKTSRDFYEYQAMRIDNVLKGK